MTLVLQLLSYDGARYLPSLFASLEKQTDRDWILYVRDQNDANSLERVATWSAVQEWKARLPIVYTEGEENLGFAGGHQILFEAHAAELVCLVNQDCLLAPNYIEELRKVFVDPSVAAAEGSILRYALDENGKPITSNEVDSIGLKRTRWHAVTDVRDEKNSFALFGLSGCLPIYRRCAVAATDPKGRLFDPAYFLYKEDVDIAYRLRRAGWRSVVVPSAVAWHHRSFRPGGHKTVSAQRAYLSYRNHWWNLCTHLRARDWARDGVFILPYEAAKAGYLFVFHPTFLFRAFAETRAHWPELMKKRRHLGTQEHRNAGTQLVTKESGPAYLRTCEPALLPVDVAIVMTTFNKLIPGCLASVRKAMETSSLKTGFVLVDNASTAFDADEAAKEIPSAIVIRHGKNNGFGRGCNDGAREVSARAYLFLNPDTIVHDPNLIETLFAFLQTHPKAGITAPRLRYPDGTLQETCRRFPAWHIPLLRRTSLSARAWSRDALDQFLMRDFDHASSRLIDWAQGSALLVDGELFHALGGFDERYFMYYEDVDLCRRAWLAGRPVYYVPAAELTHEYGRASKDGGVLHSLWRSRLARQHILSWAKYTMSWGGRRLHPTSSMTRKD